jgi:hypothetical protein
MCRLSYVVRRSADRRKRFSSDPPPPPPPPPPPRPRNPPRPRPPSGGTRRLIAVQESDQSKKTPSHVFTPKYVVRSSTQNKPRHTYVKHIPMWNRGERKGGTSNSPFDDTPAPISISGSSMTMPSSRGTPPVPPYSAVKTHLRSASVSREIGIMLIPVL